MCFKKEDELKKYFVLVFGVLLILAFTLEARAEVGRERPKFEKPQPFRAEAATKLSGYEGKEKKVGPKFEKPQPFRAEAATKLSGYEGKEKKVGPKFEKPQPFRAEGATGLSGVNRLGIERVKFDRPQRTQFQKPNKITIGNMR
jgi:hypothetical protein